MASVRRSSCCRTPRPPRSCPRRSRTRSGHLAAKIMSVEIVVPDYLAQPAPSAAASTAPSIAGPGPGAEPASGPSLPSWTNDPKPERRPTTPVVTMRGIGAALRRRRRARWRRPGPARRVRSMRSSARTAPARRRSCASSRVSSVRDRASITVGGRTVTDRATSRRPTGWASPWSTSTSCCSRR